MPIRKNNPVYKKNCSHKKSCVLTNNVTQSKSMQQPFTQEILPFNTQEIIPTPILQHEFTKEHTCSFTQQQKQQLITPHKVRAVEKTISRKPEVLENIIEQCALKTTVTDNPKHIKKTYTDLLQHPQLWRGKDLPKIEATHTVASGYKELDDHLAGGGWPNAGLVDIILPNAGIGELRLLLPALKTLAESRWLAWINPPFIPYAPALEAAGIESKKILLIYTKSHEEMLWAMEQTCKSGSCGAVLVWPNEQKLSLKETRRIQLAAKQGLTLSILFRPIAASSRASLAELRLALSPHTDPLYLSVDIIKRRGGWPLKGLTLPIAATTQSQYSSATKVRQKLSLWRGQQKEKQRLEQMLKQQSENNIETANHLDNYVTSYLENTDTNILIPPLH
jgi:cell division inhibitor SulA/protein ImuA